MCDLTSKVGVPGNDWKDLVLEATTEVLKLDSSPVALLFQALLQFVTRMAARSVQLLMLSLFMYIEVQVAVLLVSPHSHANDFIPVDV